MQEGTIGGNLQISVGFIFTTQHHSDSQLHLHWTCPLGIDVSRRLLEKIEMEVIVVLGIRLWSGGDGGSAWTEIALPILPSLPDMRPTNSSEKLEFMVSISAVNDLHCFLPVVWYLEQEYTKKCWWKRGRTVCCEVEDDKQHEEPAKEKKCGTEARTSITAPLSTAIGPLAEITFLGKLASDAPVTIRRAVLSGRNWREARYRKLQDVRGLTFLL